MARLRDKRPEEIRFLLNRKGMTFAYIDRKYRLPTDTACKTARVPHAEGEAAIADALGLSPQKIWPSRFDSRTGERLKPQPAENYSHAPRLRHCLKGEAA